MTFTGTDIESGLLFVLAPFVALELAEIIKGPFNKFET